MKTPKKYSFKWFANIPSIKEWLDAFNSDWTKQNYIRYLRGFCRFFDIDNPEDILNNGGEENRQRFLEFQENHDKRMTKETKTMLKSFLKFHGKEFELPLFENRDGHGRFVKRERNYEYLLDSDVIRFWINDYRAENTRIGYLSHMHRFLTCFELTPEELLKLPIKQVKRLLKEIRNDFIQQDKLSVAKRINIVIKSFFEAHEIQFPLTRKDKVKVIRKRVAFIPSKRDVYKLVDMCGNIRNKAIFLCLYQSGVRINCLTKWTFGMVEEYLYPEIKLPVRLKITGELDSKIKSYDLTYYYAFLQDEAADALKTYIEWRKEVHDWQPQDDDIIFVSESVDDEIRLVTSSALNFSLKKIAKNVGIDPKSIWIHVFRKAFRKILYKAEIDPDLSEAIMGHLVHGSKHNYFDYHDVNWIAEKYMECSFSREGIGRMAYLEKKTKEQNGIIENLKAELQTERERTTEQMDDLINRLSDLEKAVKTKKSKE